MKRIVIFSVVALLATAAGAGVEPLRHYCFTLSPTDGEEDENNVFPLAQVRWVAGDPPTYTPVATVKNQLDAQPAGRKALYFAAEQMGIGEDTVYEWVMDTFDDCVVTGEDPECIFSPWFVNWAEKDTVNAAYFSDLHDLGADVDILVVDCEESIRWVTLRTTYYYSKYDYYDDWLVADGNWAATSAALYDLAITAGYNPNDFDLDFNDINGSSGATWWGWWSTGDYNYAQFIWNQNAYNRTTAVLNSTVFEPAALFWPDAEMSNYQYFTLGGGEAWSVGYGYNQQMSLSFSFLAESPLHRNDDCGTCNAKSLYRIERYANEATLSEWNPPSGDANYVEHGFNNYNILVGYVRYFRNFNYADSTRHLHPWICGSDYDENYWTNTEDGNDPNYWKEVMIHAGCHGADTFFWWNGYNSEADGDVNTVGDVLSELDDMIGWDDRFLITFDALDWDDAGILSGMRIPSQGKEIYRYTPSNKSSPISNSPATWYIADQNVTPVANGSIYTPSGGSISDAGSWIVVQFVFSVQDNSGLTVAYFDDSGNVVLKGDLEEGEGSGPSGTYGAGLKVKDSTNDLMIIDATTGNMFIRGQLYEEQSSLSPSQQVDEFIMKDGDGTVVAYLDPSGNLYLSGVLYEDMNP